jgi:hypothetical protein
VTNPKIMSEMSRSKKKLMTLITMLERNVPPKVESLYIEVLVVHIYMSTSTQP